MNWRGIKAIIIKDLQVVLRNKMILMTMLIVPVVFMVLIPAGIGIGVNLAGKAIMDDIDDLQTMIDNMPPEIMAQFEDMDPARLVLELMLIYMFAPFFLIVPIMVASVIAADSFVGERERKTLEALLLTPLTDAELVVAKMLAAWLAGVAISLISFILYAIVTNAVGWPIIGRLFFPNAMWLILVFWVSPAAAAMGLGIMVVGSSRVKTFQEAYQMSGILVLPIVALMLGQIGGIIFLSAWLAVFLGLGIWIIDGIILGIGFGAFDRDAMLSKL